MNTTIIFSIFYIILMGYFLTGILLRDLKSIALAVSLGILGIFIARYIRDRPEGSNLNGIRLKDKRV